MHHLGLLVLAAEESEPSKAPFYVAGGVLAAWAVLVSFVGITRPDFPTSATAMRGVCAISVLLAATAMTLAVVTA
jgi:hypothetical protein